MKNKRIYSIEEYKKSPRGKKLIPILNRLIIEGILCIICSIILICYSIIKAKKWPFYLLSITIGIGGIIFLVVQYIIRKKEYRNNIFLTRKK